MSLKITKPGFFSTIQDAGRTGYQRQGFPVSGALDQDAYLLGNILTGNEKQQAAIEMTYTGITAIFNADCTVAVTGGDCTPLINNHPIGMNTAVAVRRGQILRCPAVINGCRSYLSVSGGFSVPLVMGSTSTNIRCTTGGYKGRKLEQGDCIPFQQAGLIPPLLEKREVPLRHYEEHTSIRIVWGPQDDKFTPEAKLLLTSCAFTVGAASDRMGMRLDGPVLPATNGYDIITDGTAWGSIQVSSSGKPIILLADRQTTGGYAKIATVITMDLALLAQLKPGSQLRFLPVSIEKAQQLYCQRMEHYEILKRRLEP